MTDFSQIHKPVLLQECVDLVTPALQMCIRDRVHLVRADAEAADGGQCGACIDDRSGHRGLGTYAKHVDTLERVDEFPFRERTLAGLHFESVGAKALRGEWMNVFQQ